MHRQNLTMEEFYTVNQAAIVLKIHPLTVRRYIKEGKLKAYRAGGNIRIAVNDLKSFTQSFITHPRQVKMRQTNQSNAFSLTDPLLNLKGRGLSMSKLK